MAQTSSGMSFVAARVFVSPAGVTWTDVSGYGASIAVGGGTREVGEQNTFEGEIPIVKAGKLSALTVTVRYVYTEGASDPFEVIRAQYEAIGGPLQVQYTPEQPGGFWFSTGSGVCTDFVYPQGEAGPGDIVMAEFTVTCASLTKASASS